MICADENLQGQEIISQILMGLGVQHIARVQSAEEFRAALTEKAFDLVLLDAGLSGNGFAEIRWLRTSRLEPNRFAPVIILASHTPRSQVEEARDCGASFVVAKPLSPSIILQRLLWIGRAGRIFVETAAYSGPDRRFHNQGLPDGMAGRRKDDLSASIGEAVAPNMSQDEIDNMLKPQRMAL
ncbi:MAG: response regulator [Brevundimonas sp.]|uniref:response regulator n=1 Tax=Brevundimonas sp. TaxID=1871086 RepID=UPI004034B5F6